MIPLKEMEKVAFWHNLGTAQQEQLTRLARLNESLEGTMLFRHGRSGPFGSFLRNGNAGSEIDDAEETIQETDPAGSDDLLGWTAVLGRPVMTATTRAATRCRLAVLELLRVLDRCERDPAWRAPSSA